MTDTTQATDGDDPAEQKRYNRARKRVLALKGFYAHLVTYVAVNIFLHVIDFLDGGYDWAYWPLMGWGIAIVMQASSVFVFFGGSDWEERKIRELMAKDKADKGS